VKDWIKKNINPPGIQKKNRGALFSAIGKIGAIVRDDATTAFNAHFPYLADAKKLAEHGRALEVPRFINDTDGEYRDRVTAASFFHMKTGERGYILSQLAAHFGERVSTREEFLRIYTQVTDLTNEEILWIKNFLDAFTDPVIALAFIDAENRTENFQLEEIQDFYFDWIHHDDLAASETFVTRLKLYLKDGFKQAHKYNGTYKYDGTIKYGGGDYSVSDILGVKVSPAPDTDAVDPRDESVFSLGAGLTDAFGRRYTYNKQYKYNGAIQYNSAYGVSDQFGLQGHAALTLTEPADITEACTLNITDTAHYNGKHKYNGKRKYSAKIIQEVSQ
jgi:hypothetical protein